MLVCFIIFAITVLGIRIYMKSEKSVEKKLILFIVLVEAIGCVVSVTDYVDCNYLASNEIKRDKAGEGKHVEDILAEVKEVELSEEVSLDVDAIKYSKKQACKILEKATKEVEDSFLGNNESLDYVIYDVVLKNSAQNGLVDVKWEMENDNIVDTMGRLHMNEVKVDSMMMTATAILSLEDFESVDTISFVVCQPKKGSKEAIRRQLLQLISSADEKSKDKQKLILPEKVENYEVVWKKTNRRRGEMICFLGIITSIALIIGKKEEERHKKKYHRKALLRDYPDIVSGMALLIAAGVSTKSAWYRIAEQYQKRNIQKEGYEEILKTYFEMKDGVGEIQAYENFGQRIHVKEYRKLSMLLIQNITKGTKGITEKLQEEEERAFEERRNKARRIGEEASTKLLLPMMMLLGIVITVLIIPAMLQVKI